MPSGSRTAVELAVFGVDLVEPAAPVVANANVALSNPTTTTITTRTEARRIAVTAENTIEKYVAWLFAVEAIASAASDGRGSP